MEVMSPSGALIQIAERGAELDVWGAIFPKLYASFDSFCFLQSTVEPKHKLALRWNYQILITLGGKMRKQILFYIRE